MLRFQEVSKRYAKATTVVEALAQVDLSIAQGEFVAIKGPSGSGKSTLLLAAGGMLRPSAGKVLVDGEDIYGLSGAARSAFRGAHVGFVFQMFHLLPYLSVLDNILVALGADHSPQRALETLEGLHLSHRLTHLPAELSAGERQRVAVARALVNQPKIILADEPTGNLDPENAAEVMGYLGEYHKAGGTVVLVTHGEDATAYSQRTVLMEAGRIRTAT